MAVELGKQISLIIAPLECNAEMLSANPDMRMFPPQRSELELHLTASTSPVHLILYELDHAALLSNSQTCICDSTSACQ